MLPSACRKPKVGTRSPFLKLTSFARGVLERDVLQEIAVDLLGHLVGIELALVVHVVPFEVEDRFGTFAAFFLVKFFELQINRLTISPSGIASPGGSTAL